MVLQVFLMANEMASLETGFVDASGFEILLSEKFLKDGVGVAVLQGMRELGS